MWIYVEDEQTKDMLVEIKDNKGNPTGKQRILIPAFNRHQRWPLGYGCEITYWWGTSKISKTVKCLAK